MHFVKENIYSIFISTLTLYLTLAFFNKNIELALFSIALSVISAIAVVKKEWIKKNFWHLF